MRLVLKTKNKNIYCVQLPNHIDQDKIPLIVEEAKLFLPKNEELAEHYVNSDSYTNDERKQLDIYGEIKYPMTCIDLTF